MSRDTSWQTTRVVCNFHTILDFYIMIWQKKKTENKTFIFFPFCTPRKYSMEIIFEAYIQGKKTINKRWILHINLMHNIYVFGIK